MSKQDKKKESMADERKKSFVTPQGSHKEKALENVENSDSENQGHLQGIKGEGNKTIKNEENKQNNPQSSSRSPHNFDRNEGQEKPQKFSKK
jgi:hypothetical protein